MFRKILLALAFVPVTPIAAVVVPLLSSSGTAAAAAAEPEAGDRKISVVELKGTQDGKLFARATVDIAAPREAVFDQLLDFDARAEDSWLVRSVKVYDEHRQGNSLQRKARWELKVFGTQVIYHSTYEAHRDRGTLSWALDPARANDIQGGSGEYVVTAVPGNPGRSRVVYTFEVATQYKVGKALRRRLTYRGVKAMLEHVRERAEVAA